MKSRPAFLRRALLAAAACALLLASCTERKPAPSPLPAATAFDTSPLKLEPLPSGFPGSARKAAVAYLEGEASVLRSGERIALEIGDGIVAGDVVETGPLSACEIRLGGAGTARLEENSSLAVDAILLGETRRRVGLTLRAGVLLSKVEKLLDSDAYTVRGPAMVCGVRGTRFALSAAPSGSTLLAVAEGRVKALPASPALDRIAEAARSDGVARAALAIALSLGPEVGEGMELSFGPAESARAEKSYARLEAIVKGAAPQPLDPSDELAGIVPAADPSASSSARAVFSGRFAETAMLSGPPLPASEKAKALFSGFERMDPAKRALPASPRPLDPAILGLHDAGGRPVVGEIVQYKGLVLLSNADGEIGAYDASGKEAWRARTDNPASSHSYPTVYKDKIYYSGSRSFAIIDGKTGAILRQEPLPAGGRDGLRPYQFPGGILEPRADGIDLIDPDSGERTGSIEVPEGLMMSPAAYKSKNIVYVTATGLFRLVRSSDKAVIKEIQTKARGISQQTLRNRGSLYFFADSSGMAVLIDAEADAPVWEMRVEGASAAEAEMGRAAVYLPTEKGLAIIRISDGEIVATVAGVSGPPLLSNDDLFVCLDSGELIVARADPFTEITRISLPFVGSARPLIVGKSLWVAGRGGKMVRIDPGLLKSGS